MNCPEKKDWVLEGKNWSVERTSCDKKRMVRAGKSYGAHLYLLAMGDLVKVGRSMDVVRRVSEHRRANPWGDIRLIATYEGAGCLEPMVLRALSQHERRSEWVHCSVQEALQAVASVFL